MSIKTTKYNVEFCMKHGLVPLDNQTSTQFMEGIPSYTSIHDHEIIISQYNFSSGESLVDKDLWCVSLRRGVYNLYVIITNEFVKDKGFELPINELKQKIRKLWEDTKKEL